MVNGVPYEESFRSPDVISKGVRFCVVQTDTPPSEKGPGNPPLFLSNVFRLGAKEKEGHRDMWTFKPPDGSERSCFVRCSATSAYEHPEDTTNAAASAGTSRRRNKDPSEELYLFMEFVTTFKVNPNINVGRKGVVKGEKGAKGENKDVKDSTSGGFRLFGGSSGADKDEKRSKTRRGQRRGDDDSDDEPTEQDESPTRGRSSSPDTRRPRADMTDIEATQDYEGEIPTVEMSCGFAMINIYDVFNEGTQKGTSNIRVSRPIHGGSPFSMVDVSALRENPKSIVRSVYHAVRGIQPEVSIQIKALSVPVNVSNIDHNNMGGGTLQGTAVPKFRESGALVNTFNAMNFHPKPSRSLYSLLPPNVVLPYKAVLLVGVFRDLLDLTMQNTVVSHTERLLPQTAPAQRADILLSAFPQLLGDRAAMEVLMLVWSLQVEPELANKKGGLSSINSNELEKESVRSTFRECVIRVWRAYNSPNAQKTRLRPTESAEELRIRKRYIQEMIGFEVKNKCIYPLDPPGGRKNYEANGLNEDGGIEYKKIRDRGSNKQKGILDYLGSPGDQLHVPFSTQELHASRRVNIDRIIYTD